MTSPEEARPNQDFSFLQILAVQDLLIDTLPYLLSKTVSSFGVIPTPARGSTETPRIQTTYCCKTINIPGVGYAQQLLK
jgi:hypothetical protein